MALVLAVSLWNAPQARASKESPRHPVGPKTEAVESARYEKIYYISESGGSDETGIGSREQPWKSLSAALDNAQPTGDRRVAILVSEGRYLGTEIRLKPGVDLYGGFDPKTWTRNLEKHVSILDGEEKRRVAVGADNARLDGFTITGGRSEEFGGGILCSNCSPEISNNRIENNATLKPADFNTENAIHQEGNGGGGIACIGASPIIRNNRITGNRTDVGNGGGLLCLSGSSPRVIRNLFAQNQTGLRDEQTRSSNGAGIGCSHYSAPLIRANVILENYASGRGDGGGIYAEYFSDPRIENNTLSRNTSDDDGAGVYVMRGSQAVLAGNTLVGNGQGGKGGSTIRLSKGGSAALEGNRVVGNDTGGVTIVDSWAETHNNLFAHNRGGGVSGVRATLNCVNDTFCDLEGSGISFEAGNLYLKNAIVAENTGQQVAISQGYALFFNCLIQGGTFHHGEAGGQIPVNGEISGYLRGTNNIDGTPGVVSDSSSAKAAQIRYDARLFSTLCKLDSTDLLTREVVGEPIRVGEVWGVVKSVENGELAVWGNLFEGADVPPPSVSLFVPGSYHLAPDSMCVDAGESLGAPSTDRDGEPRPIHLVTEGRVDIGSDELR